MSSALGWRRISMDYVIRRSGPWRGVSPDVRIDPLESARVQTLRGVACLLLVAFHTIGSTAASGLRVSDDSLYREFTNLFVHVRMPVFTFLSGFIYACRPLQAGRELQFLGKKLRRLGVPLIVATTLLYGLHAGMHHRVPAPMWTVYVFPYWHLWFVQALLLVFVALVALESLGALSTVTRFLAVLTIALALYFTGPFGARDVFGVHNATYLLPFFLCGLAAHRFRQLLHSRRALTVTVLCLVVAQSIHTYIVLTRPVAPIDPVADRSGWNLLIGMSASLCALQLLPRMRLMERIGGSSYAIYLYHPLFVAAVLAAAQAVAPRGLLFVVAGIAGVTGPMLMEWVARHIPAGQLLLEGQVGAARIRTADVHVRRRRPVDSPPRSSTKETSPALR